MYAIVINYLYFQWLREKERTVSKETARSKIGGEEEMEQKKKNQSVLGYLPLLLYNLLQKLWEAYTISVF